MVVGTMQQQNQKDGRFPTARVQFGEMSDEMDEKSLMLHRDAEGEVPDHAMSFLFNCTLPAFFLHQHLSSRGFPKPSTTVH